MAGAGGNGSDRTERQARFWLRAYPVRWRASRADELVAVLHDVAGPDGLPWRERLGLLRAGWATRWHDGPPLHIRVAYRFDLRVPVRYREWARDDIAGRWYHTRRWVWQLGTLATIMFALPWWDGLVLWPRIVVSVLAVVTLVGALWQDRRPANDPGRDRMSRHHLLPAPDEPAVPGGLGRGSTAQVRVRARSGSAPAVAALLVLGLGFGAMTLALVVDHRGVGLAPATTAGLLGAALLTGALATWGARRRLAQLLPALPAQPWRRLVGRSAEIPVRIACVAANPTLMIAVTAGQGSPLPVWAAAACLALLPVAVGIHLVVRREHDDLAWSDVWSVVVLGAVPGVDLPVPTPVRLPAARLGPPSPGGA